MNQIVTESNEGLIKSIKLLCGDDLSRGNIENVISNIKRVQRCLDESEWVQEMIRNNASANEIADEIIIRMKYIMEQKKLKEQNAKEYQLN
ncbi:hypothetical protein [Clostridium sp. UBA1652]|uniref:hypothetical protein n=1 Tax=Clostridium sp. UBA1652 TaxID=1946348 RepID=UPI00257AF2E3|nr:hypothetical protein [Clostridium sp. UBA1652]